MKIVGLLFIAIFIVFFSGCAESLLIKKVDLQYLMDYMKENTDQLETVSHQQEKMGQQIEKEQEASNQAMKDFSQGISLQLQEITKKQDKQEKRLKKMEKVYNEIHRQELQNAESRLWETQNVKYADNSGDKQVVGAVEKVLITPPGEILSARIDTGAVTSSLDATDIEWFERNGRDWVRFKITNPKTNKEFTLERRIVRNVKIIQAVMDEVERRSVVKLEVTIGKTTQNAEFTLSDRGHMEYPVLIGRNILMDIMVVDVSKSHIAPPLVQVESKGDAGKP